MKYSKLRLNIASDLLTSKYCIKSILKYKQKSICIDFTSNQHQFNKYAKYQKEYSME